MDMETRVQLLEEWRKEVHPKFDELTRAISVNTEATKDLIVMLNAGTFIGSFLKWVAMIATGVGSIWLIFHSK